MAVNAVAWAPYEIGFPLLACGSSDGDITLLSCRDGTWAVQRIPRAHQTGVSAVSWAPINVDEKQAVGGPPFIWGFPASFIDSNPLVCRMVVFWSVSCLAAATTKPRCFDLCFVASTRG